ncbi:imidazolonepropionase [Feifania hominis]|uniref:Imidazolonepropionase n=1 Tax=Feifania hominis TaxID=2763660 RepID=A0A926HPJ7_9FIRM|nr:imidazolonepropionase [Feifania hominis]MBC8535352.1 imidazolonepropionase [Feifania hominis]
MNSHADLLIKNIGLLATPTGSVPKAGAAQGQIETHENVCVAMGGGVFLGVGSEEQLRSFVDADTAVLDAGGCLATPGLVDAHTHLVFGGWRQHELGLKLHGVPYLDILKSGGGILSTVRATRAASLDELVGKGVGLLHTMLEHGTTTCEAKSGYGLSTEEEKKQLLAIRKLDDIQPVDLVATFMGAHALPEEYSDDREGYVRLLIEQMIPLVAKERLAEFCDIFCETGVFSAEESRRILTAAREHGLKTKIHADEIDAIGGAVLAGELPTHSAEHLIAADDEGLAAMARGGTIAVVLPATSFYLGKPFARVQDMMSLGIPVAVASDFNPGSSPNLSLQLPMNLACYQYKMTPEQVLTAVTLNAAAAIGRAETVGTVEPGKKADLVLWDAPDLDFIFYRYGNNQVRTVVKNGTVMIERG